MTDLLSSGFRSPLVVDANEKSIFPEFKIDIPMPQATIAPTVPTPMETPRSIPTDPGDTPLRAR